MNRGGARYLPPMPPSKFGPGPVALSRHLVFPGVPCRPAPSSRLLGTTYGGLSNFLDADWLKPLLSRDLPISPSQNSAAHRRLPFAAKRANSAFTIVCCLNCHRHHINVYKISVVNYPNGTWTCQEPFILCHK